MKIALFSFFMLLLLIICSSCEVDVTRPVQRDYMIPELIYIDQNLIFTMGNSWGDPVDDSEIPAHKVKLSPYFIGKYEVTNGEYHYFVKDGGYSDSSCWSKDGWIFIKKRGITRPVHWDTTENPWKDYASSNRFNTPICNISWYEAEAYCNWLSKKTGNNFHLPTEAQWERAARGPDPGRKFPWGNTNDFNRYNEVGWPTGDTILTVIGSYENGKSYDGCYDMAGNVMEYCFDWYDAKENRYYQFCYDQGTVIDPAGPSQGFQKVFRGYMVGVLSNDRTREIRTTRRMNVLFDLLDYRLGFRLVKSSN
jgi:formylglycine-generating enzyme required for sulfatase activity